MPRLAVIDAAAVDGRRRLVLVRRDNVEHLLMIGGPTDIVVEPNIVRAMPGRDQMPQRPGVGRRAAAPGCAAARCRPGPTAMGRRLRSCRAANARAAAAAGPALFCRRSPPPGADAGRSDAREPQPIAQRADRRGDRRLTGFARSRSAVRWAAVRTPPRTARRTDALARDVAQRTDDAAPAAPERGAEGAASGSRRRTSPPPRRRPPPPPTPAMSAADQNLAEMAQRLEAALRRPGRRRRRAAGRRAAGCARTAARPRHPQRATAGPAGCRRPRRRAALKISKTRWRPCWAVRRPLREIGALPA